MQLPTLNLENELWQKGFNYIIGIDEVGRGSWAGPLVAAGVILPKNFQVPDKFNESKSLSPKARELFDIFVKKSAISYLVAEVSNQDIDKIGLTEATQKVFSEITTKIKPKPEFVLIDAFKIKKLSHKIQNAIKYGDKISVSIAAASILAKVHRDKLMKIESEQFPNYGFEGHKGYGTRNHQEAIKKYGLCPIHRKSYNLGLYTNESI